MPWNVRIGGYSIPMTAVIGGIGTAGAWVAVLALHTEARTIGIPWMVAGMTFYFIYRKRNGLSPTKVYRIARAQRPADFEELDYRTALVPIFGTDISAAALRAAAKLIGADGVVYAVFVLPVPSQLSLEAGLEAEEAQGRSVLESARIVARRTGIKVHTGPDPHPERGSDARRRGRACQCRRHLLVDDPCAGDEQGIGPTASYLLAKRPCRVIIESERAPAAGSAAAGGRIAIAG